MRGEAKGSTIAVRMARVRPAVREECGVMATREDRVPCPRVTSRKASAWCPHIAMPRGKWLAGISAPTRCMTIWRLPKRMGDARTFSAEAPDALPASMARHGLLLEVDAARHGDDQIRRLIGLLRRRTTTSMRTIS